MEKLPLYSTIPLDWHSTFQPGKLFFSYTCRTHMRKGLLTIYHFNGGILYVIQQLVKAKQIEETIYGCKPTLSPTKRRFTPSTTNSIIAPKLRRVSMKRFSPITFLLPIYCCHVLCHYKLYLYFLVTVSVNL